MGDPGRRLPSLDELTERMRALTRSTAALRNRLPITPANQGQGSCSDGRNVAVGYAVGSADPEVGAALGRIELEINRVADQLREGLCVANDVQGSDTQRQLDSITSAVRRMEIQMFGLLSGREPTVAEKTCLAQAANDGDCHTVNGLLGQGVQPNAALDAEGRTALHIAAAKGHVGVVQALLDGGACRDLRTASLKGWEGGRRVADSSLSWGPAAVVFRGNLYCFHQNFANNELRYNVHDGVKWSGVQRVPGALLSCDPSVVVFGDRLHCLYKAVGMSGSLCHSVFDGKTWLENRIVPTSFLFWGPSAVVFGDRLFCCYMAAGSDGALAYNVYNGADWAGEMRVPKARLTHRPSAVAFQGLLYCFYQGASGNGRLFYSTYNGRDWEAPEEVAKARLAWGPSAVEFNGKLYCFHPGLPAIWQLWYNVFDGVRWEGDRQVPYTGLTDAPSAVAFNGSLHCFHRGVANSPELWCNVLHSGDLDGMTALHWAAMQGHASVCECLVRDGGRVDVAAMHGDTALHFAAENGREEVVKLLLDRGADPEAKNKNRKTAKQVATGSAQSLL